MVRLEPPLRLATEADAPVLAVLNNEGSHGVALHAWRLMAGPGEDPWAFGTSLQRKRARDGLWVVIDEGGAPVAGLMTRSPTVGAPDPGLPAFFQPMIELEQLEPEALFINLLAALPPARGRGLGARLLQVAEDIARAGGRPRLSLIVADENKGARRLYARTGYRERGARPRIGLSWDVPGSAWLLMVKELA